MSVVAIVLIFLFAVIVSVFISRLLSEKIPLPLIQIAVGACLSIFGFEVAFDPHLFLFLFIPPLLFLDGWRIPKEALFQEIKPIMSLAIGLVVVTVIGMGFFYSLAYSFYFACDCFCISRDFIANRSCFCVCNDRQFATSFTYDTYFRRRVVTQ